MKFTTPKIYLLWLITKLSHSLPQLGDPLIMSLLLLGVSIPLSLGCIRTQTCILSGRSLIFACRLGCPQCWAMYSPKCKSLSLKVFNVWYISLFIFWEKKRKTQQATVLSKISLFFYLWAKHISNMFHSKLSVLK